MDVQVVLAVIRQVNADGLGLAAQIAQRRLCAFLHHVAERTGEDQTSAGAFHHRDFDVEDLPPELGPGQTGRHAGDTGMGGLFKA